MYASPVTRMTSQESQPSVSISARDIGRKGAMPKRCAQCLRYAGSCLGTAAFIRLFPLCGGLPLPPLLQPARIAADFDDFAQRVRQRWIFARDAARRVPQQAVLKIDLKFVPGIAHVCRADAVGQNP